MDELERAWHAVTSDPSDGRVSVDLTDVTFVDEEGRKLLEAMYGEGAKLKASGCATRRLVEKIGHSFHRLSQVDRSESPVTRRKLINSQFSVFSKPYSTGQ